MAKGKNDFDKFLSQNIDKAVQTVPQSGDDGVGPVAADPNQGMIDMVLAAQKAQGETPQAVVPSILVEVKIPESLSDTQKELLRSVMESRSNPVGLQQPVKPAESVGAAWNPYQQFYDRPQPDTLASHVSGGSLPDVKPKEGVSPALVEAYTLLRTLVAGGWIMPGLRAVEAETLVRKLKTEVEQETQRSTVEG